ncbi:energy-coupled thiamine transporter ThiT [uncultured Allobaculum sp.]|uniref:energy-coupled thiamine transporter ThiT n=1 Tax=uncultured Allobaculum sp. TaxID=1187017 RepID=UPI0025936B82|nr:energy-coupled thiamine transporter ThiT [uncultured Allobaculum sp.]
MLTQILIVVSLIAYFGISLWLVKDVKLTTSSISICAICIALTLILESIFIPLPTGAVITLCSPVPLLVLAICFDPKLAILSGWITGLLSIALLPTWQPVHWAQIFVEHLVCFSCLGYAGLFSAKTKLGILPGLLLAFAIKFMGHAASGVVFFSQNAWSGWGPWAYSMTYHLTSKVPLFLLCTLVMLALPLKTLEHLGKSKMVKKGAAQ